jgi:prephenate dehydrogenase
VSGVEDSRRLPMVPPGRGPGRPPIFEKIGIIGLGLIGGSIAMAARQHWPGGLVIAVDTKDVLEQAMVLHAIDVAADDPVVLAEADLIVLAAPVRQNLAWLEALPQHVEGAAVVTDTGSTKREIVAASRALPSRLTFVGGHPLGGAARGGIAHARPDLFVGRPWLFTPPDGLPDGVPERLIEFATTLGALPRSMAPQVHDHLLAYISHLPQLVSSALMHVVGEAAGPDGLALTGRGLQDVTRLASSPADIWRDVTASNADEIDQALDSLIGVLNDIRQDLGGAATLDRIFTSANKWREELHNSKPAGP